MTSTPLPPLSQSLRQVNFSKALDQNRKKTRGRKYLSLKFLLTLSILALDYLGAPHSTTSTTTGLLGVGVLADVVYISTVVQVTKTVPPAGSAPTSAGEAGTVASETSAVATGLPVSEEQHTEGGVQHTKVVGTGTDSGGTAATATLATSESSTITALNPPSITTTVLSTTATTTTTPTHHPSQGSDTSASADSTTLKKKLPTYATAAIACSVIVFLAILGLVIFFLLRRRQSQKAEMGPFSNKSSGQRQTLKKNPQGKGRARSSDLTSFKSRTMGEETLYENTPPVPPVSNGFQERAGWPDETIRKQHTISPSPVRTTRFSSMGVNDNDAQSSPSSRAEYRGTGPTLYEQSAHYQASKGMPARLKPAMTPMQLQGQTGDSISQKGERNRGSLSPSSEYSNYQEGIMDAAAQIESLAHDPRLSSLEVNDIAIREGPERQPKIKHKPSVKGYDLSTPSKGNWI